MRVHANQVNPYAQLDAMHAAQKAAARREAARIRKKLFEGAAEVAGENEFESAGAVTYNAQEEESSEKQPGRDRSTHSSTHNKDVGGKVISDWA